jgi:hypothetical protein
MSLTRRLGSRRLPLMLLAMAMLAGIALTVARSRPASAYDVARNPDEIVFTRTRLHDETVRATIIVKLERNGDIFTHVDAHNSGKTRKYFDAWADIHSPAADIDLHPGLYTRISKDTYQGFDSKSFSEKLALRFDQLRDDPNLAASLHLNGYRVNVDSIVVGEP